MILLKIYIEKNILSIDNYNQIIDVKSDLIKLENIEIAGSDLSIRFLDKYRIVVSGSFKNIRLGE